MMRHVVCAAVTVVCGLIAAPSTAQSLGELARQEEARRATTTKKAVKSFSNADLAPSEITNPSAPAPAAAVAPCDPKVSKDKCPSPDDSAAKPAAPDEAQPADAAPQQVEADWRRNAEDLRRQLAKARTDYEAVAAAADDESRLPGERAAAARVVAQHQRFIERLESRWARFEKQAEELGVPTAWIEPKPTLSMRIPQ